MDYPSHEEHRRIWRDYGSAITKAKQEHWTSFLEGLSFADVWTANRYISGDSSDGGKTRIPTLTLQPSNTEEVPTVASTNKDKSVMLMRLMFPNRPSDSPSFPETYEDQLPPPVEITEGQIQRHITNLNPYKVPGIDGICYDLICLGLGPIPEPCPVRSDSRVFQPRRIARRDASCDPALTHMSCACIRSPMNARPQRVRARLLLTSPARDLVYKSPLYPETN